MYTCTYNTYQSTADQRHYHQPIYVLVRMYITYIYVYVKYLTYCIVFSGFFFFSFNFSKDVTPLQKKLVKYQ